MASAIIKQLMVPAPVTIIQESIPTEELAEKRHFGTSYTYPNTGSKHEGNNNGNAWHDALMDKVGCVC